MYRGLENPSYTRREYITGVPGSKVAQFNMGNLEADPEDFPVQISLRLDEATQVRHGSLESARLSANRLMLKQVGQMGYKMVLRKFPHQILRENKQATGAGRVCPRATACSPSTAAQRTPPSPRTHSAVRTTSSRHRAPWTSSAATTS
jgi:ribosomal protein L10e